MSKKRLFLVLFGLLLAAVLLYQIPPIQRRLSWRIDIARTYLRGILQPAGPVPTARPATPLAETSTATSSPQPTPTSNQPTATPTATLIVEQSTIELTATLALTSQVTIVSEEESQHTSGDDNHY